MVLALGAPAQADQDINSSTFPDAAFRDYVSKHFDTNGDNKLDGTELNNVKAIHVSAMNITSLTGVEHFLYLEALYCSSNQLTALSLTKNTKLTKLNCDNNQLTALNLSDNAALEQVLCRNNKLTTINLENANNLKQLACQYNKLTSITLKDGVKLEALTCDYDMTISDGSFNLNFSAFRAVYGSTIDIDSSKPMKAYYKNGGSSTASQASIVETEEGQTLLLFLNPDNKTPNRIKFAGKYSDGSAVEIVVYRPLEEGETPEDPADEEGTPSIFITTSDLPNGALGTPYSQTLTAAGNESATWMLTDGTLPDGLVLGTDGTITGTPTQAGAFTFTVQASGFYRSAERSFTILVAFSETRAPSITTEALAEGFVGSPYGFRLTSKGTMPITWSVPEGSTLPEGLSLTTTGYLYGTPAASGNFDVTVKAKNDEDEKTATFTLTVSASPSRARPAISEIVEPATKDTPYTCQLVAYGTPPFEWTVKGKMPAGLSMSSTGLITGSPSKTGAKKLVLTVSNDYGQETKKLLLTTYTLPSIMTGTLKDAVVDKKYSAAIKGKSSKPFTWELEGTLPQGITMFDADTAKITGIPPTNDKGMVRITLSNPVGEISRVYSLAVNAIKPKISPTKLSKGTYDKKYKVVIKSSSGTKPITISLSGDLPAGLSFDRSTGLMGGTPSEVCTDLPLTVFASNLWGIMSKDYLLTIKAINPKITTKKLSDAVAGTAYSADLEASGTPPITWAAQGLPKGLTMSEAGRIDGTPTEHGKFSVKISVANAGKTVNKTFKLIVLAAPSFGNETLTAGAQGKSYNATITANGSAPITYSISGGALPSGLTMNNKGKLKGKPSTGGNFTFTVKAKNSVDSTEKEFTLNVTPAASNGGSLPGDTWTSYGVDTDGTPELPDSVKKTAGDAPAADKVTALYGGNSGAETGGCVVVAVLPEVSVDVSGMYDFSVALSDDARAGEELVYLAGSSDPSEDDNIAEFSDESGHETAEVPESREVTLSVWLRGGVTYKPSIAVKR